VQDKNCLTLGVFVSSVDTAGMRALVIFTLLALMDALLGWQPSVGALHELLVLQGWLLLQRVVEELPRSDELARGFHPFLCLSCGRTQWFSMVSSLCSRVLREELMKS